MNILISGASGLTGSALRRQLACQGHNVFQLVRSNQNQLFTWQPETDQIQLDPDVNLDVVINLSGESSKGRWTKAKKAEILNSRIRSTELLVETMANLETKPKLFISASAVGYYGDTGYQSVDEHSDAGNAFLSDVAIRWEQTALALEAAGVRTVCVRSGVILSTEGGALKEMLTPFKWCLGGVLGNGNQYWSWVSIDEWVNMIEFIISNEAIQGSVNLVSRQPVTNREFTRSLAKALGRPAIFPMPECLVKLIFGEMGEQMLLSSTRVNPTKLIEAGYSFLHEDLDSALKTLVKTTESFSD